MLGRRGQRIAEQPQRRGRLDVGAVMPHVRRDNACGSDVHPNRRDRDDGHDVLPQHGHQRRHLQFHLRRFAGGPGTLTQTSRFASRADIVDEVSVIPPLSRSLGTTTVTTIGGFALTATATNSYDSQRRLTSVAIVTSPVPLSTTFTYAAWDASGRPTAGTVAISPGPSGSVSITYNNPDRTVTRNDGLNTCIQRSDLNGNIQGETCTGTSPSTTTVTVQSTLQICK